MNLLGFAVTAKCYVILAIMFGLVTSLHGQKYDSVERERVKGMLKVIKSNVKKDYFDPNFGGIDLEARFSAAEERLSQATSTQQALGIIAQVLVDFNDSHLFFIPPATNLVVDYGWKMQAFGNDIYVTSVKPKSDAEAKGVKVGDMIAAIGGFKPNRKELWKMLYYYNTISRRDRMSLTLLSPGASAPRTVEVLSDMKRSPQAITFQTYFRAFDDFHNEENDKHRFQTIGSVNVWRMPGFDFDPNQVDVIMGRFSQGQPLIIDLRGNPGGYVKTLERLAGYFFETDMKLADLKGRKPMDPMLAKTKGKDVFKGRLIVLTDARSGSASEIFARVIQLEKRGTVLGDVSSGAVRQSRTEQGKLGTDSIVLFGVSVTNADVIMSDGKTLEHVGVQPDELIIPTPDDLANGRDPVLARAVELLGARISPEDAGKLFRYYYWKN
jgi:C-terminal processing protease CtpA/Prc